MRRRAQSTAKWILTAATLTALAVAAGFGVLRLVRPGVEVTEVVEGPVVQAFYSTGTVSPDREFAIKTSIEGTLTEVRVDKGDRVKKGDVLAFVSDPELALMADKARAELREKEQLADAKTSPALLELDAKANASAEMLEIAKREQQRVGTMLEKNAASQSDIDRALDRVKL